MRPATTQAALFYAVPDLRHVESLLLNVEAQRDDLLDGVRDCNRELHRLHALVHALRALAAHPRGAQVAVLLAEKGWSGTGEQLVAVARSVVAQAGTS